MFKTKIDLSDNRQAKQDQGSITELPGKTVFGADMGDLISGPNLDTKQIIPPGTNNISGSFKTKDNTDINDYDYVYSFNDYNSAFIEKFILPFTSPTEIGSTQELGPIWVGTNPTEDNGTIYTSYEGHFFNFELFDLETMVDPDDDVEKIMGSIVGHVTKYRADALDYNGDFVWVNVKGTTETNKLKINNTPTGGGTPLSVDSEGNVVGDGSDIRLKENINKIPNALSKLLQLRGVKYNWKDRKGGGNDVRVGFIAQEVEKIMPELVYNTGSDDYLGVYYSNVVALIIEAMKELVGDGLDTVNKREINVEVVYSEDNSIELNYSGTKQTSLNGGIIIKKGVNENEDSKLIIDENGDWTILPNIKIKEFTPSNSSDSTGNKGNISFDDDYIYIRTNNGWKRTGLTNF